LAQLSRAAPGIYLAELLPFTLLPLVLCTLRRRKRLTGSMLLLAITGCASSRIIPTSTGAPTTYVPTPAGTYNLTVTATTAGLTHTVPITLIIQ
jgi:hypothetical protein